MDDFRKKYNQEYYELGSKMFTNCNIPTVYDFVDAFVNKKDAAMKKITKITDFTGNHKDIINSVNRRNDMYSDAESDKFMQSVIASHVTDITESGYFYKKLISSCDDMTIEIDDCGSTGYEMQLPIDEDTFNYKVRNHWIVELNKYIEDYNELPTSGTIHIRNFLTCKHGNRHFCAKCAGIFRRSYSTNFVPKNIGAYSTLMITEHATQGALDAMNKDGGESINVLLEQHINCKTLEEGKEIIKEIIDTIGNVGVESRFYEIALLSRWRGNKFISMEYSFLNQNDLLGAFIYKSNPKNFNKLLLNEEPFKADSMKTKIAFDMYDDED